MSRKTRHTGYSVLDPTVPYECFERLGAAIVMSAYKDLVKAYSELYCVTFDKEDVNNPMYVRKRKMLTPRGKPTKRLLKRLNAKIAEELEPFEQDELAYYTSASLSAISDRARKEAIIRVKQKTEVRPRITK